MSEVDGTALKELAAAMLGLVRQIGDVLAGPSAPDAEVKAYELWLDAVEPVISCADQDCPLQAESSIILQADYTTPGMEFTINALHEAVGRHIALRRQREAEMAAGEWD
jgi:hypothetical protein